MYMFFFIFVATKSCFRTSVCRPKTNWRNISSRGLHSFARYIIKYKSSSKHY